MRVRIAAAAVLLLGLALAPGAMGTVTQVPDSLVFVRGGDVYRMYIDGSETVQMTATTVKEADPAVSRDSLRIAFVRGADELWTMDTQGNSQQKVVAARPRSVRYAGTGSPTWSADDRSLVFDRVSQTPKEICGSIFRVGAAGGSPKRVTAGVVKGSLDSDPAVSPDGSRIALSSGECEPGIGADLTVVALSGRPTSDLRKLGSTPGIQIDPAWAPDAKRLAFVVYDVDNERSAVYVVNRDGSRLRRITQRTPATGAPAWSPDGQLIAFHKEGGLFVIRPDGTGLQRVPGTKAGDTSPAWLPRS